jgi:phage terminase Nu1 subunit (DNA packaging protein)
MGQKYIAHVYGLTFQTIQGWKGCPRNKDKSYNLRDVVQWRRDQDTMGGESNGGSDELEKWRAARRAMAELDLAKRQGELAEVVQVDAEISRMVVTFKQALLALPSALAPRLEGMEAREIAALLDIEVRRILSDLKKKEAS